MVCYEGWQPSPIVEGAIMSALPCSKMIPWSNQAGILAPIAPPLPPVWLSTHKRKWPNLGRCLIARFIRDVLWSQPFFFSSYSLIPLISYTLFSMNAPLEQSRQRIATRMRKHCIDEFIRLLHSDLYLNVRVFLERVALCQSQSFHYQLPYRIIYWALLKLHWMELGSLCWCFVLMYALMELYAWTLN